MHFMTPNSVGAGFLGSVAAVCILAAITAGQPVSRPTRGQLMRQKLIMSKGLVNR